MTYLMKRRTTGRLAASRVTGIARQWKQRFTYDKVGHRSAASEYQSGDSNCRSYLINYDYDRFGNRFQKQARITDNPFMQSWVTEADISKLKGCSSNLMQHKEVFMCHNHVTFKRLITAIL